MRRRVQSECRVLRLTTKRLLFEPIRYARRVAGGMGVRAEGDGGGCSGSEVNYEIQNVRIIDGE